MKALILAAALLAPALCAANTPLNGGTVGGTVTVVDNGPGCEFCGCADKGVGYVVDYKDLFKSWSTTKAAV